MKKTFSLLVASLLATVTVLADVVTPSQALQIAEDFLGEELAPQRVRGMRGMDAAPEQDNAPLYVISRGDDKGFVLVSGDDCLTSIIGYTDHGNFDEDNLPPALQDIIDCVDEAVRAAQKGHTPTRPVRTAPADWCSVDPLIQSHWNQGGPYNDLCPICPDNGERAVVGCVPTAATQILYYFRKDLPHELQETTPTYSGGSSTCCDVTVSYPKGTPIEYDLMFDSYSGGEPADIRQAVALLCYTFGACAHTGYWHSSGTSSRDAVKAMTNYFGLTGTYVERNTSEPQENWEAMLYNDLIQGRPMLYGGYKVNGGGHGFLLDGYDAKSGMWHFNFGWGGSSDGYYTLDLNTGVNGYVKWQDVIYDIHPYHLNISAEPLSIETLYKQIDNTVTANITSNSTLPVTDFSLYLMPTDEAPTSESTPAATNGQTCVAPDETVPVAFDVRPTELGDYYLYVTDVNGDVLTHKKVTVVEAAPQLTLQDLTTSLGMESVETAQGSYQKLNNDAITLYATVSNAATATPGAPDLTFTLTQWDAEQGTNVALQTATVDDTVILPGESKQIACTFTDLPTDALVTATVSATNCTLATADTTLCFVVGGRTLTASEPVDGTVTVTGGWDATVFAELASDAAVTAYDLTAVNGLQAPLTAANPNALFYVSTPIEGSNIVVDGQCADLRLTSGYDFRPVAPFHAAAAAYDAHLVPAVWNTLTLPFVCERPEGWICRQVNAMSSSAITEATLVDTLQTSQSYLVMADSRTALPFTATDVEVMADVDRTLDTPFIGTYRAVRAQPLLHEGDACIVSLDTDPTATTPYFQKADTTYVLPPFQAVLSSTSKKVRATVDTKLDPLYRKLATAIDEAMALYDDMHSEIADSANLAMETLLAEARGTFYDMSGESKDALNALIKQLNTLCTTYPLQVKTVTRPIDYTQYLTNPSFESNSKAGWTGDAYAAVKKAGDLSLYTLKADGTYVLYNNKSGASTEISQTVSELPNGYYRVHAMVGTSVDGTVTLFAGDKEVTATTVKAEKYYLREAVVNSVCVKNGELTVGIRAGETWYKADDFRIYYLGPLTGDDLTAIDELRIDEPQPALVDDAIYDLLGRKLSSADAMQPGINIVRKSDGTVRKIFVK